MRRIAIALAATATLFVGAAPSVAQPPRPMPPRADMTPEQALPFVRMAAASDLYEIQSSRLALQRSRNPEIRRFAQMLITHHTQTTRSVTAAARRSRITPPPPRLMPMQQQMMNELRRARGNDFDRVFMMQQVPAHEMALALHRNYASRGDRPALRQAASAAVPIVEQHLAQARSMRR